MTAADTPGGGGGGMVPGSPPSKQNLISWWKQFSKKGAKPSDKEGLSTGLIPHRCLDLLRPQAQSLTLHLMQRSPAFSKYPCGKV